MLLAFSTQDMTLISMFQFCIILKFCISSIICGISDKTRREHIVRAALESVCHQTRSVATAMATDCAPLGRLLADGGMAQNTLLMQMQADILGIPVV